MTEYNELRDGQEFYGNGYKQGYADAKLKYNSGEKIMPDKIKQAIADEFKYRASKGRPIYTIEEVIYIVNEVIDEVNFETDGDISQKQLKDFDLRMRIIKGDLKYLAERVNELSSQLEEQKIKSGKEGTERPQGEWGEWIRLDLAKRVIAKFKGYLDEDMIERIQMALEKENIVDMWKGGTE